MAQPVGKVPLKETNTQLSGAARGKSAAQPIHTRRGSGMASGNSWSDKMKGGK